VPIRRKKRPLARPPLKRFAPPRIGHNLGPQLEQGARLIGYARVSTVDQDLSMQVSALERVGVHPDNIWHEKASGVKQRRPQRDLALMDARAGDVFLVYKLDRLGRSFRDLLDITQALKDRGIGFRSLTEGFDTTTAAGKFLFHILAAGAEFERDMTVARTTDGMAEAKRQGRQVGAPLYMTPKRVAYVERRLIRGHTIVKIASDMGISRQTLYTRFNVDKIKRLRAAAKRKRRK